MREWMNKFLIQELQMYFVLTGCAPETCNGRTFFQSIAKARLHIFDYLAGWINPAFERLSRMR